MADKWVVYVTYGVYVDVDKVLDPENSQADEEELVTRAVLKMWQHGYTTVKNDCSVEYENVTQEFADNNPSPTQTKDN
jgi:hypothetical protein